ncbi:AAA-domain-containing protein [Collybia nuda]|uniref:Peroxisomal ATPase PEX6 n=1 Tax=Collybia nuda TaxID=64659 RepID=A0A9P5YCU8_9AGAR|nr:AAA-domain-containing protein [Collybia nuda]
MVEPVLQGFTQRGTTRFIVTVSDPGPTSGSDEVTAEELDSDKEGVEIDEAFLANSTFMRFLDPPKSHNSPPNLVVLNDSNGIFPPQPHFQVHPLLRPGSISDEHCILYLRTVDLGRVGVISGDWAMVRSCNKAKARLVRVVADDVLVNRISPILLHNICSSSEDIYSAQDTLILLHPSPFGSRQPVVPTARTVTVARIASPISANRKYQPNFLRSLKAYFDSTRRLVKQGDIIAVPLDTDVTQYIEETNSDENEDSGDIDIFEDKYPTFPSRANELAFFCITNVEHDVLKNDSSADVYLGSTVGELGCWVDPSITRLVQTGVEHSRVPDVGTYLKLDSMSPRAFYSMLVRQPHSYLLGANAPFTKLVALSSAAFAQHAINYQLDLSVLLKGARGIGKFTTAAWVAQHLGIHLLEIDCYDIVGENDTQTEGTLRARFDKAENCSPCILILRGIEALAQTTQVLETGKEPSIANALRECIEATKKGWVTSGYPTITVATTSEPGRVPTSVLACFKHEVLFEAPNEDERREILDCSLADTILGPDVSLGNIATQTAALVASDLSDLVLRAKYAATERVVRATEQHTHYLLHAGIALTSADFETALGKARASYSESIGAPKIPNVSWDDVGGLAHVKADILDTVQLPLDHPELFADGLKKRSGILLYGPPGTGKTLLAKAVATSCSLNFFSIKGPELLNMYIGESEANVRRVFQRARDAKPCVIFFDELDSVAPKRGNHGDSGGVMDRIVSQLLAELDGMSAGKGGADVFVIGATNRPDLLDPALLRPGRFDRMLYLGVSNTHEAQRDILEALTRKFRLDSELDLDDIARHCPFNYTGADFYALCSDAMLNAMSRKAEALEYKIAKLNKLVGPYSHPHPLTPQYYLAEMASKEDMEVLVSRKDFDLALSTLVPSVSQSEMDHYAHIQRKFSRTTSPEE